MGKIMNTTAQLHRVTTRPLANLGRKIKNSTKDFTHTVAFTADEISKNAKIRKAQEILENEKQAMAEAKAVLQGANTTK